MYLQSIAFMHTYILCEVLIVQHSSNLSQEHSYLTSLSSDMICIILSGVSQASLARVWYVQEICREGLIEKLILGR